MQPQNTAQTDATRPKRAGHARKKKSATHVPPHGMLDTCQNPPYMLPNVREREHSNSCAMMSDVRCKRDAKTRRQPRDQAV